MNNYDETFIRIRNMTRRHKEVVKAQSAEVYNEVKALTARFVAAGWSSTWEPACRWDFVEVCDPNGHQHDWYIDNAGDLESCLVALEAAERTK